MHMMHGLKDTPYILNNINKVVLGKVYNGRLIKNFRRIPALCTFQEPNETFRWEDFSRYSIIWTGKLDTGFLRDLHLKKGKWKQ